MTIPENQEVIDVCKAVEEWRQEERAEGRAEGVSEERLSAIKRMIDKNYTDTQIMDLEYTMDEINVACQKCN